ncbi:hypothetical protein [Halococcus agarilyticus]|uniref:hypothetical protein n=1 Tax=Halococcus agarilyticus TaxID=1232219 RepID=UPI0006775B65|nr:hypothetical protein [Halococcus agarilyticus]
MSTPSLPPGPLESSFVPVVTGVVIGFVAARELRRHGIDRPRIRGVGLGLVVALFSVFSLPVGVVSGIVVFLLVRG